MMLLLGAFVLGVLGLKAQQVTTGQVTDQAGNPISGARVEARGSKFFTTTGIDGRFSLETPVKIDKVRVSAAGRVTRKVDVSPNMVVTMRNSTFWTQRPVRYQFFVSPQITIPGPETKDIPLGLMAGVVKDVGLYGRFVVSGMPSTVGAVMSENNYFWDDMKTGYQAFTGGAIVRLAGPVYLTVGGGYAKRKVAMQHQTGAWYDIDDYGGSYSGLAVELGAMMRLGHFVVNGGSTMWNTSDGFFSANFGVGYMF